MKTSCKIFFLIFIFGLILFCACTPETTVPLQPLTAEFGMPGVLNVKNAQGISEITVEDAFGQKIARALTLGRSNFEIRFDWASGETYALVTDTDKRVFVPAPLKKPELVLRIHAPLGQNQHAFFLWALGENKLDQNKLNQKNPDIENAPAPIALLADAGETVDILVEVEKLSGEKPSEFFISIMSEDAVLEPPVLESVVTNVQKTLRFEFDKAIWQNRITLKESLPNEPLFVTIQRREQVFRVPLVVTKRDVDADAVAINKWEMPVDAWGLFQAHRLPEQVTLPNPVWNKIGTFFNVQTGRLSFFDPFVYQRLDIENTNEHALNLLLKSAVVDKDTGNYIRWFAPPDFSMSKGPKDEKGVLGYCRIPARSEKSCVLPIFVHPETPAGLYERRVEIFPMGSNKRMRLLHSPFSVVRSNTLFTFWLVLVMLVSLGWLLVTIVFYRRIIGNFGVRLLVLVSLLGSMQFCLQFGSRMVSTVLYAFLGPLNCLVGGLLSEVMTYLIVTAVLYLVPRVGAMTLAGIISYLMGGILFGSFGLTDILFTGSAIAFQEICLFSVGVTRIRVPDHYVPPFVPMMLALGLADAMSTFTSLTLHSVFYRLFFADWYIVMNVVVTGFCYTLVGVFLGRPIGQSLRKVHL